MAEKLKTKTAPKAAAKNGAATKEQDGETKRRGRIAADFKYAHMMTLKQAMEKVRAGSWTARMLEIIMSHKNSAAAREALANDSEYKDRRLDFKWAADKGFIAIN